MIEQVMYFSLGFLLAVLLALALAPAFWHRAIRLVTRKLELQLPLSAREVYATRDLVRAELAVEQRRLEQKLQALDEVHARDMAELGHRAVRLAETEAELAVLRERYEVLDAEKIDLDHALAEATSELGAAAAALDDAKERCGRDEAEIDHLQRRLEVMQTLCANQRMALTVLERDLVHEREARTLEAVKVARLDDELSALQVEHDAALTRLKAAGSTVEEISRSEPVAVRGSGTLEEPKAQPSALSAGLGHMIDRLQADLQAYGDAVEVGSAPADRTILRKRISEIGAAALALAEAEGSPSPGRTRARSASVAPGPKVGPDRSASGSTG